MRGSLLFACAFVLPAIGCDQVSGTGKPKTEARTVAPFERIAIGGILHADIAVGGTQSVELSGDDNLVPLVTTEVTTGELRVEPSKSMRPKLDLIVRAALPKLTALAISGTTNVKVRGASGDKLEVHTSGSSQVALSGTVRELVLDVSGTGSVDATQLTALAVKVNASGSAKLDVTATDALDVTISGAATVRYAGNPRDVRKAISGSGKLKAR